MIPIGRDRYELYCEGLVLFADEAQGASDGWFARLRQRCSHMIREAEREEDDGTPQPVESGWRNRVRRRISAWVAERVAEQRLLWNLRREREAVVVHPQDMTFDQTRTLVNRMLQRDYNRHRRWVIIDGAAFLVTFIALGPLFLLIPGVANLPALYFAFRVVGHWLSMRGAAQGIHRVAWKGEASTRLVDLRAAIMRDPSARSPEVMAIALGLGLPKLSAFVGRVATR